MDEPLLGPEGEQGLARHQEEASSSHEGGPSRGWLSEQLRAAAHSPSRDGTAGVPPGYQMPKLATRTMHRTQSMHTSRAR